MRLMDSMKIDGPEEVLYFRKKLEVQGAGPCSAEALQNSYPLPEAHPIDSLVQRGDTVFCRYWGVSERFFFLPQASVGQSWTVSSTYSSNEYSEIAITCTGIGFETFLGVSDSVRTFSMTANGSSPGQVQVSDFTMRLSRSYGLLEHVPFQLFLIHPPSEDFKTLQLIGFEKNGESRGFQPPRFDDFFHPQAGDVLLWEDHYEPGWIGEQPWTIYHRDSTTAVMAYPDSLVIQYDRMVQHQDLSITDMSGLSRTIARARFAGLVECPNNWVAAANNEFTDDVPTGGTTLWVSNTMGITPVFSEDTVVTVTASTSYSNIDTLSCDAGEAFDVGHDLWFDTKAGLIRSCHWLNPSTTCSTLIGWRINGVQNGNIALSLSGTLSMRDLSIHVFPNPAQDRLFGQDVPNGTPYELRNTLGEILGNGTTTSEGILLADLTPGVYVVLFATTHGSVSGRFVKN